jgi:hypothetical protein
MCNFNGHLGSPSMPKNRFVITETKINKTNLVARYQSLPKRNFAFLSMWQKINKNCCPFTRAFEHGE